MSVCSPTRWISEDAMSQRLSIQAHYPWGRFPMLNPNGTELSKVVLPCSSLEPRRDFVARVESAPLVQVLLERALQEVVQQ